MKRVLFLVLPLVLAYAQTKEHAALVNIPRAAALQSRFAQFGNPVSRTFSTSRLGALLCKYDPVVGSSILRASIGELNVIPANAFSQTSTLLPVPSFSKLTRIVVGLAGQCDPSLGIHLAADHVRARIREERNSVNSWITEAYASITDKPDRAAQLLSAAISAADPGFIDMAKLVRSLSELRYRAPELADDIFLEAVQFAAKDNIPIPGYLNELGKYLFTAVQHLELDDRYQTSREQEIGQSTIVDFQETRRSTNPEAVTAYLQAVIDLTRSETAALADPAISYSLTYQMLSMAQRYAPDLIPQFQQAEPQMLSLAAANVGTIQSFLGSRSGQPINDEDLDAARRRDWAIQRFQVSWHAGNLDEARSFMSKVDDMIVRAQLSRLIQWKEVIQALERKDDNLAMATANAFPQGIKRAVLYCVIANKTADQGLAQQALNLAWRDTESQIAERREFALLVIATNLLARGIDSGYSVLAQAITAHNEALTRPRREKFDPAAVRKVYSAGRDPAFESSLLVRYGRPLYEVIDSGRSRFSFQLPAAAAGLEPLILSLKGADIERLSGVLNLLRDEARLGPALVALAELQLKG